MKCFLNLIAFLMALFVGAQPTYHKTLNSDEVSDSIENHLKENNLAFVKFSNPSYWTTSDSTKIDYYNSHLFIFEDTIGKVQSLLVTEFFIFREDRNTEVVFEFFRWNQAQLFNTQLRPNDDDLLRRPIDSAILKSLGYKTTDDLSFIDSVMILAIGPNYEHYTRGVDGLPNQYITLSNMDTTRKILIDQYVFFPNNYYYRYNCQLPLYTLRLLLLQKLESLKSSIEFMLENEEISSFDSLGRLQFDDNPKFFEKIYTQHIDYWIERAKQDLKKDWKLEKPKENE